MTEDTTPLRCPACGHDLSPKAVDDLTVDACDGGCGGIWFDNGEIAEVDDRDETAGEALAEIKERWASAVDRTRKRACPRCSGILMLKRQFGPRQPVEIDECPGCGGIWLDAGELSQIREAFEGSGERAQVEAAMSAVIANQVQRATAGEARKTRAFHAVAKFLGHMWHDYGLTHFRGREWPPWRGRFVIEENRASRRAENRYAGAFAVIGLALFFAVGALPASADEEVEVSRLIEMLKSRLVAEREEAAEKLTALQSPRVIEPLLTAVREKDPHSYSASILALGTIYEGMGRKTASAIMPTDRHGMPATADVLATLISVAQTDRSEGARQAAAQALGKVADSRGVAALVGCLSDDSPSVRGAAAIALDALSWQPTDDSQRATHLLAKRDWDGLVVMGEAAVEPLIAALSGGDRAIRSSTADALARIGDQRAVAPLARIVDVGPATATYHERMALKALGGTRAETALESDRRRQTGKTPAKEWMLWGFTIVAFVLAVLLAARMSNCTVLGPTAAAFAMAGMIAAGVLMIVHDKGIGSSVFRVVVAAIATGGTAWHLLAGHRAAVDAGSDGPGLYRRRLYVVFSLAFLVLAVSFLAPNEDLRTSGGHIIGLALAGVACWDMAHAVWLAVRRPSRSSAVKPTRFRTVLSALGRMAGFAIMLAGGAGCYWCLQMIALDACIYAGTSSGGWGLALGIPFLGMSLAVFGAGAALFVLLSVGKCKHMT